MSIQYSLFTFEILAHTRMCLGVDVLVREIYTVEVHLLVRRSLCLCVWGCPCNCAGACPCEVHVIRRMHVIVGSM